MTKRPPSKLLKKTCICFKDSCFGKRVPTLYPGLVWVLLSQHSLTDVPCLLQHPIKNTSPVKYGIVCQTGCCVASMVVYDSS